MHSFSLQWYSPRLATVQPRTTRIATTYRVITRTVCSNSRCFVWYALFIRATCARRPVRRPLVARTCRVRVSRRVLILARHFASPAILKSVTFLRCDAMRALRLLRPGIVAVDRGKVLFSSTVFFSASCEMMFNTSSTSSLHTHGGSGAPRQHRFTVHVFPKRPPLQVRVRRRSVPSHMQVPERMHGGRNIAQVLGGRTGDGLEDGEGVDGDGDGELDGDGDVDGVDGPEGAGLLSLEGDEDEDDDDDDEPEPLLLLLLPAAGAGDRVEGLRQHTRSLHPVSWLLSF